MSDVLAGNGGKRRRRGHGQNVQNDPERMFTVVPSGDSVEALAAKARLS